MQLSLPFYWYKFHFIMNEHFVIDKIDHCWPKFLTFDITTMYLNYRKALFQIKYILFSSPFTYWIIHISIAQYHIIIFQQIYYTIGQYLNSHVVHYIAKNEIHVHTWNDTFMNNHLENFRFLVKHHRLGLTLKKLNMYWLYK